MIGLCLRLQQGLPGFVKDLLQISTIEAVGNPRHDGIDSRLAGDRSDPEQYSGSLLDELHQ